MSANLKYLVICAVLIRVFLASFLYHPDLRVYFFHGQFLSQGVFNIYPFLEANRNHLANSNRFNYPPLAYFFFGGWHAIASAISGPSLNAWLNDWSSQDIVHSNLFFYLLLLKVPYFAIDFAALAILLSLAPSSKRGVFTLVWLFNPITLYGTYAVGQFDLLPTLLTLLALAQAEKNHLTKSSLLLVIAGLLKSYPLLLLPFVWLKSGSFKKALWLGLSSGGVWLLLQAPFIFSRGYSESVFTSGLAQRVISTTISIGSDLSLSPFIALIVLLFCYSLISKVSLKFQFLAVTLSVILFAPFHAQWLIWFLPFAMLLWCDKKRLWLPAGMITVSAFALVFLLPDKFMSVGLLSGFNSYLLTIPPLTSFMPMDVLEKVVSIARTILITSGLWSLYASPKS